MLAHQPGFPLPNEVAYVWNWEKLRKECGSPAAPDMILKEWSMRDRVIVCQLDNQSAASSNQRSGPGRTVQF
jgi:hypothetical protein